MKPHLEALNVDFDILADTNVPEHPPWLLRKPSVILQLTELRKSGTHPLEYQRLHAEIQCQFEDHISVYTVSGQTYLAMRCIFPVRHCMSFWEALLARSHFTHSVRTSLCSGLGLCYLHPHVDGADMESESFQVGGGGTH